MELCESNRTLCSTERIAGEEGGESKEKGAPGVELELTFPFPTFSFLKVTEHNVLFPDEYDEIERSLGPYRAFTTEDLAQRIKKSEELRETVKIRVFSGQTQVVVSFTSFVLFPRRVRERTKAHVFWAGWSVHSWTLCRRLLDP